jgi:hypothetical protein
MVTQPCAGEHGTGVLAVSLCVSLCVGCRLFYQLMYRSAGALPYPGVVKLPRLRTAERPADEAEAEMDLVDDGTVIRGAFTPAKGRPTPKRREAEGRRRGPVAPPPTTQREAIRRSRGDKAERRTATAQRRERMAAGDDRYLLARDKGPVRAYVRDIVDSRRHLIGLFMPLAVLVLVAMVSPVPALQSYAAPGTLVVLVVMVLEGVLLARTVIKRVHEKFPQASDKSMSLGWYSFVRASQIRKLRIPKPVKKPGDTVA